MRRPTSMKLTWRKWPAGWILRDKLRSGMLLMNMAGDVVLVGDINSWGGGSESDPFSYPIVAYSVTLCSLYTSFGRRKELEKIAKKFQNKE